jgi:hypothetical protein
LLLKDIKEFKSDVLHFREDFLRNGPMVDGIAPNDAVDRLSRFKEELKIRERKMDSYRGLGFLYLFYASSICNNMFSLRLVFSRFYCICLRLDTTYISRLCCACLVTQGVSGSFYSTYFHYTPVHHFLSLPYAPFSPSQWRGTICPPTDKLPRARTDPEGSQASRPAVHALCGCVGHSKRLEGSPVV